MFVSAKKSFRYISEKDNGTYDAMNKGARMAQGEWINYMNAGDSFYTTTTLQEVFSHKITDNVGVVYGDTLQVFDFGSGIAKASDYMKENINIRAALVSTNSITQGESVSILWKPLFEDGIQIDYAYRTFIWDSEASIKAHVHLSLIHI